MERRGCPSTLYYRRCQRRRALREGLYQTAYGRDDGELCHHVLDAVIPIPARAYRRFQICRCDGKDLLEPGFCRADDRWRRQSLFYAPEWLYAAGILS